jgi:hypothetical protein
MKTKYVLILLILFCSCVQQTNRSFRLVKRLDSGIVEERLLHKEQKVGDTLLLQFDLFTEGKVVVLK